ncbi:hypothetical protein AHAS_Ahas13G0286700 [Arachis hypogaea]
MKQNECYNKRRYEYLKMLISYSNPPMEEPNTLKTSSDHGREGNQVENTEAVQSHQPEDIGGRDADTSLAHH